MPALIVTPAKELVKKSGWRWPGGGIGSCCRPLMRPLILRQAQDEVVFVGGCHEKPILMLSLSKHDGRICNCPRNQPTVRWMDGPRLSPG
jgi:hypothetical protein